MGATTIALARGLKVNKKVTRKPFRIHAFDIFLAEEWFNSFPGHSGATIPVGQSFYPYFLEKIRPYYKYVVPYPYDLLKQQWHGLSIEILHSDATKSFELCRAISCSFYPQLLPESGILIEQDFLHWYTPWVHRLIFHIRDCIEPVSLVGTSMVFRCIRRIDKSRLEKFRLVDASDKEIDEIFSFSKSIVAGAADWRHAAIDAAKAMFYAHTDRLSKAEAVVLEALEKGANVNSDLSLVIPFIEDLRRQSTT